MTAQDTKDWRVLCTDMYVMLERGELEPRLVDEWRRRWRNLAEQSFTHQELFQAGLAQVTLGTGDHLLFSLVDRRPSIQASHGATSGRRR